MRRLALILLILPDDGEYYRATGAALTMAPPPAVRRWWELRAYAERHAVVERNTRVALARLWTDSVFRPNIATDEGTQYGGIGLARPWWGSDPQGFQTGMEVLLQGETGAFQHARGQATLRAALPLGPAVRIGGEAGVGTAEGDVPIQRNFFLGGASTLRGYQASTVSGTCMARARLELARATPFANLAVFSDWGWAGDRREMRREDQRWSVGVVSSLLDGLVRLDLARGLREPRGWRLDLYLDALL